jgi:4-hydroxymandelate oxidase
MNCKIFIYDEDVGEPRLNLLPGTKVEDIPDSYRCPVCGFPKSYLKPLDETSTPEKDEIKDLNYYRNRSREMLGGLCGVYPVCNGDPDHLCMGQKYGAPIGLGGAGQGKTFEANYKALQQYRLKMRVIKKHHDPEISTKIFGKKIIAPIMGAPLSGAKLSLNDAISEEDLYWALLKGAQDFGSIGMVGNTSTSPDELGAHIVGKNKGWGIPVFKPHPQKRLIELFKIAEKLDVIAIGVDLDGSGSTYWTPEKNVYRKSENELQELVDCTKKPVFFKGIMSPEDAVKVVDSGASACYVSNHGGRVLDSGQGVADVLPDIAGGKLVKIPVKNNRTSMIINPETILAS